MKMSSGDTDTRERLTINGKKFTILEIINCDIEDLIIKYNKIGGLAAITDNRFLGGVKIP